MSSPIIDLHCDLLAYLAENPRHTPYDEEALCSVNQLKGGHVAVQILALFTETEPGSSKKFNDQLAHYRNSLAFLPRLRDSDWEALSKLHVAIAIENASGLAEEDEPLELALKRLATLQASEGPILYTSLTWNTENRFGGGNKTNIGLKRDGEILIDHLNELGIPIDLSHTSDPLADAILNYLYKKSLKVSVIASHSNFREVHNVARNLPTDVALEINRLGGVIGLNFFAPFVGPNSSYLLKHIEFAHDLGIEKSLCFGADFFSGLDIPLDYPRPLFFNEIGSARCYPNLMAQMAPKHQLIAHHNASVFILETVNRSLCD